MSVIGIDFGSESCYVAAAKAGGIETLANDYSLRATPSFVAFDGKKRIIGVAAKNQQVTNMKNTVSGFKHLLGRRYNDPHVQNEMNNIPTKLEARPDGSVGIKVNYLDQEQLFTPEQVTAMLFTKLKETSTNALQAQVNDCVICCPIYFTNAERRAVLDAAHIAGLNVLRLMNDTTATALSYGFYKQDLPEDKPRNVVFIDCGHSSLQVSAAAFTRGKLRMIASTWDQIGGRDFDAVLADHFAKEFYDRYKINAKNNARAYLRLITEIEKLKKQMSANSTKLPLNIECFMDDIDVSSSMQRTDMEQLCGHLFQRVELTFKRLLQESKLQLDEIHSVEIVGGSSRIPAIKHLIETVFGTVPSTTLNQDESVSRGAALQCAIMSPAVRVRDFGVTDIQNYAVKVSWDAVQAQSAGEIEVFPVFHPAPFSRLLTLHRREPFYLTVQYAQPIPYPDPIIGKWLIKDVKPTDTNDYQEVKIKMRINLHGIVFISNANLVEKHTEQQIQAEQSAAANATLGGGNNSATSLEQQSNAGSSTSVGGNGDPEQGNTAEPMDTSQEGGGEKKKKSTKVIELPLELNTQGFPSYNLEDLIQQEAKMMANDAKETARIDAKNGLEEYVYDIRNKLQGGPLEPFVVTEERESLCSQLNDLENWLYEDGEDCAREIYVDRLNKLREQIDPIRERAHDYEYNPGAFEELKKAINNARTIYNEYKKCSPKFEHLTEAEFLNVIEAADKAQKWLDQNYAKFVQASHTTNSPVKLNDIRTQWQQLTNTVNTVVNRPKPTKPSTTNIPKKDNGGGQDSQQQNGGDDLKQQQQSTGGANNIPEDSTMDVE